MIQDGRADQRPDLHWLLLHRWPISKKGKKNSFATSFEQKPIKHNKQKVQIGLLARCVQCNLSSSCHGLKKIELVRPLSYNDPVNAADKELLKWESVEDAQCLWLMDSSPRRWREASSSRWWWWASPAWASRPWSTRSSSQSSTGTAPCLQYRWSSHYVLLSHARQIGEVGQNYRNRKDHAGYRGSRGEAQIDDRGHTGVRRRAWGRG